MPKTVFWTPKTSFLFADFCASVLKDICFTLQKTVFWVVKDGLLEGESLSFATPNIYLSGMRDER